MSELDTLLRAVLAAPADDAPRLRYADALAQRNDPRGELIRVQCEFARKDQSSPGWEKRWETLAKRERELLQQHLAEWEKPLQGLARRMTLNRGFVELIELDADDFLAHADRIFALAPVRHLDLTNAKVRFAALMNSSHLARISSLSLAGNGLTDADAKLLADSPHLAQLTWLNLGRNAIGEAGAEALAASSRLPGLTILSMASNPCDPVEEAVRGFAKLRIDRANARMAERQNERGDDAKGPRTPDNPVARLQQHADAMAATAAALKRIAETADPLYKTLDDGQKRRLAILTHMEGRPGGEGHRGMRDRDDEHDRGGPGRFDRDHGPSPDRL